MRTRNKVTKEQNQITILHQSIFYHRSLSQHIYKCERERREPPIYGDRVITEVYHRSLSQHIYKYICRCYYQQQEMVLWQDAMKKKTHCCTQMKSRELYQSHEKRKIIGSKVKVKADGSIFVVNNIYFPGQLKSILVK
jgi:hypothetical protein